MPDLLDRVISGFWKRDSLENPKTPLSNPADWLFGALGAERADSSNVRVNPATSMGLSAFWACVKIISETVASLPLIVYRELDDYGDKEKAKNTAEYRLLHDEFNPIMTSMVARQVCQSHILTWGNAYLNIRLNGAFKNESLWPLHPSKTRATTRAGNLVYETTDTPNGRTVFYAPEEIVHLLGLSFDGVRGLSPVQVHRETIGHGIATERYGAAFFGHGERPAGVLEHPSMLNAEALARLKKQMDEIRSDVNPHKTLILEDGLKYHVISVPPDDMQYIETRLHNVADMARIFNMPLALLQVHDKAAAYASVEQFFIMFGELTIRPWLVVWEQELNRKVLGLKSGLSAEFNLDALMRGDIKSRFDAWHVALNDGFMNKDEVRMKENLNKMPDGQGQVFFVPSNQVPIDRALKEPKPAPASPADGTQPQANPPAQEGRTAHGPNGKEVHGGRA